jgi:hypothetical protein
VTEALAKKNATEPAAKKRMNFYHGGWDLDVSVCPCDVHFTDFIEEKKIRDGALFHFGTGTHHHVGVRSVENGLNNAVLAITASVEEIEAYTRLALERPEITRSYKAFFGDIYLLEKRLLPMFDAVCLPHVAEFWGPNNVAYGAMTDREMIDLLTEKTKPGGYLFFYTKSMAFDRAGPIIAKWAKESPVTDEGLYKSLAVYRKK